MAKTLDKERPASTISDMIDESLIQQATQEAQVSSATAEVVPAPNIPAAPLIPEAGQGAAQRPGVIERTGEHTDINKMYRLTPTAAATVQGLGRCLSSSLSFEINNSAVIRSILRAVHLAEAEVHGLANERLKPRQHHATAIGNEHARDALESEIAELIVEGIHQYARGDRKG